MKWIVETAPAPADFAMLSEKYDQSSKVSAKIHRLNNLTKLAKLERFIEIQILSHHVAHCIRQRAEAESALWWQRGTASPPNYIRK